MSQAIKQFNGLSGTVGTEEVKKIAILAADEGQTNLARRLQAALKEAEKYEVAIFNPGPLALEEVPACDLPGIDHVPAYISAEDFTGLNKAVSPDDIYQYITDLMINTIKKVGSLPWERNWEKTGLSNGKEATNYESKKGYRGINFFLLNFEVKEDEEGEKYLDIKNWENPYFLTFKQIEKFGGKLTKGSTGHRVVYFTKLYSHSETKKDGTKTEFATYNQKKFLSWIEKNKNNLEILTRSGWTVERLANSYIPILKYYNVFNAGDITGIEWEGIQKNENAQKTEQEKIDIAEAIVNNYPNPPKIIFGGDQPHYNINKDTVVQTPLSDFKNPQAYYSVLFHELIHSTGAEKRLSRTFGKSKNDPQYAKEELIAEMGAVFLCAESGILFRIIDNSAAYLKGWNSRLIKNMEEDNRFYFRAASASQAAADYILDRDQKGVPAYLKSKKKKSAALNAPRHEGMAKEALNECGRLQPGYRYTKGGKIVKVETGKKKKPTVGTSKKDVTGVTEKKAVVAKAEKKSTPRFNKGQTVQVSKRWGKTQSGTEGTVKELRKSAHGDPMYSVTIGKDLLFFPETVLQLPKKKLSKEELEKANPEPKAVKPKSVSVSSAIDDILKLDKYKGISPVQANIIYKYFKNDIEKLDFDEYDHSKQTHEVHSAFEVGYLKRETDFHYLENVYIDKYKGKEVATGTLILTPRGADLVQSIKNRVESLRNQKNNYALFDGLNGTKTKKTVKRNRKTVTKKTKSGLKSPTFEPKTTAGAPSIGGSFRPLLSGKKTLKASDIANMDFETLPLDEGWEKLFQQAPKNMRIAVWAKPKNGKTATCAAFASYLTKFGPILYNFADQGINLSTKNLIELSGLDKKPNAYISTTDNLNTLAEEIEATGAHHVVIDMINQYINNGVTPHIFKKEILQRFPEVGFTLVMEVTKGGDFKGDQSWTHLVDQLVTIENYIADTKGRYGTGEKITWEEGAQKYAPQRYAEIKNNETTPAVPEEKPMPATNENQETFNFTVY